MNAVRMNHNRLSVRQGAPRRGSVLIVVLALLSALMLLGFLFYTVASQERENARYYSASAKWYGNSLSGEDLCNFALEQIILGPRDDRVNSVLWGGRYSLLASLVGGDLVPYNGPGVNVADGGVLPTGNPVRESGVAVVDQDFNNAPDNLDLNGDGIDERLTLNLADWAADNPALTILPRLSPGDKLRSRTVGVANGIFPAPDANYTYPDLDSLYLGYIGDEPLTGTKVVIPSFHRPQYLRGFFGVATESTWYTNPATLTYSLRPHHKRMVKYFNYSTGLLVETTFDRFLPNFWAATGPDPISDNPDEGVWEASTNPPEYGGDPDGDGTYAAILLDLGHPAEMTSDGSQQFVPMYHVSIFDLDALFNLNAHGNLYGVPNSLAGLFRSPDPTSVFVSQSNEGRHRHEVNPVMGLTARASSATGGEHVSFFGHGPSTWWELANMEFFFVLAGRADESGGAIDQIYPGRWGEANELLKPAVLANNMSPFAYPRPGSTGIDDAPSDGGRPLRHQARRGFVFPRFLPSTLSPNSLPFFLYAGGHPADHQGQGTFVGNNGRTPNVVQINGVLGQRVSTLGYANYWFNGAFAGTGLLPKFVNAALGTPFPNIYSNVGYGLRSVAGAVAGPRLVGRLVDNPGETFLNVVSSRNQVTDSIFGAEETAALHMDTADYDRAGFVSRLLKLVPANFKDPDIRKRYTATSRDLVAYGNAVGKRFPGDIRRWEAGLNNAAGGTDPKDPEAREWNVFPPYLNSLAVDEEPFTDPSRGPVQLNQNRNVYGFRPAARAILQQQGVMASSGRTLARDVVKGLVRKLSVNHVAALAKQDGDGGYEYLLRPLTPHPVLGVQRDEIPAPKIDDTGSISRAPADAGDVPGTAGVRAHFGMPDSWLLKNALTANGRGPATWNMSSFSNADLNVLGIVDSSGNPWPEALQEWHARRDRQNLARDIYTLLYVFGHVNPDFNPTTDDPRGAGPGYSNAQMREMAQFAVNVVDAMDPDDTITLFVYDKNLSDGYTLLDSGYGTLPGGTNPAAPTFHPVTTTHPNPTWEDAERGMVYGVETQALAFSEILAVLARQYKSPGQDYAATFWDDTVCRDFLFVELQNMTPYQIPFNGGWSVVCSPIDPNPGDTIDITSAQAISLTIFGDGNSMTANPGTYVANPGATYTIATTGDDHRNDTPSTVGGTPPYPSMIRVFPTGDDATGPPDFAGFLEIAPPEAPGTFQVDFDAINELDPAFKINNFNVNQPYTDGAEVLQDPYTEAKTSGIPPKGGAWLTLGPQADRNKITNGAIEITFRLRRRLNLHRQFPLQNGAGQPQQLDNPWVTVDICKKIPLQVFNVNSQTPQSALENTIVSTKRPEPLDRANTIAATGTAPTARNVSANQTNSIGGYHNQDITNPATIFQRHYDRPFASVAGLLQVPLFAPWQLTETINLTVAQPAVIDPTAHALSRFLFPDTEPRLVNVPTPGTQIYPSRGNLWYRALGFLEVPEKYGNPDGLPWFVHYGGSVPWGDLKSQQEMHTRRFGKININTMRHPQVLGGLLDDPRVMNPANLALPNQLYLPSANGELVTVAPPRSPVDGTRNRDWWISTLASRDGGLDRLTMANMGGRRMILPGVPAAHPFKGFSVAPVPPGGTGGNAPARDIFQTFSQTMLRPLFGDQTRPYIGAIQGRRSLFALGNAGGVLGSQADLATRFRLLGKVLKHGTTRSNTYVIFITCDFYEAEPQNIPGGRVVYQVGQKMPADPGDPEEPRYRGVYVVDRTLALELLQKKDLPPLQITAQYPSGSKYRTFSFARNGNGEPKFDWKKLLLYSEIVKSE